MNISLNNLSRISLALVLAAVVSSCDSKSSAKEETIAPVKEEPKTPAVAESKASREREALALERERIALEKERAELALVQQKLANEKAAAARPSKPPLAPEDIPPTEGEMRGAFQALVDAINKENKRKADMAKNRTYDKDNPLSIFEALGGAIVGDGVITLDGFRKVGATQAVGTSGFVGEFVAKLGVEGDGNFARQMRPVLAGYSGGEVSHGRFYRFEDGWIFEGEGE